MQAVVMSSPSPTASPRMPASRAQYACQACRMSKVRCDLQCLGGGKCSRCARLALRCAPAVSKRGRANPARDIARLGPAVRALLVKNEEFLVKEEHGHDPAPVRSTDLCQYSADGPSLSMTEHSKEYDSQPLVWYGTSCPRMIVSSIDSREGKVALLKHWLRIALRSRSCELVGNTMLLAHMCGLTLDDFVLGFDTRAPPAPVPLPPFIAEWQHSARICSTRQQTEGVVDFLMNDAFKDFIGTRESIENILATNSPDEFTSQPTYPVCAAEIFIAVLIHEEDRMKFMQLSAALWALIKESGSTTNDDFPALAPLSAANVAEVAAGVLKAESVASEPIRFRTDSTGEYVPCLMRGRMYVEENSKRVWTCMELVPIESAPEAQLMLESTGGEAETDETEADQLFSLSELQDMMHCEIGQEELSAVLGVQP